MAQNSITGLALLLHELATNAVKCGSLSSSEGRVRIELSAADGEFLMTWTEEGGPEVSGPPEHAGFGSSLAHRIVTGQFGGKISYDWKRDGLVVRVTAPRLATIEKELGQGVTKCVSRTNRRLTALPQTPTKKAPAEADLPVRRGDAYQISRLMIIHNATATKHPIMMRASQVPRRRSGSSGGSYPSLLLILNGPRRREEALGARAFP